MPASTRTAEEAAAACGCAVGQIVKSLVFQGNRSGRLYLLLVSGANRVDMAKAAAQAGEPLDRADPRLVRERTGFASAALPPSATWGPARADGRRPAGVRSCVGRRRRTERGVQR